LVEAMRYAGLVISLALFVPAFAFFGLVAAHDSGGRAWLGVTVGAVIGVFFGMVFGGARGRWLGVFYPPQTKAWHDEESGDDEV
jgi:hypothetical protein